MITFLVTGIYVSIDGFFVGQAVGDIGLASVNVAWPLAALILAIGTGIGMGGAVNISNHMGADEKEKANRAFGNTMVVLLLAAIGITSFLLIFGKPLLRLMGAEGEMLELSYGYLEILAYGAVFQVCGAGIPSLLRNRNKAWVAMAVMLLNFTIDTTLSGVFVMVLGLGVKGAALATVIGEGIALISALFILFKKDSRVPASCFKLCKETVGHILKCGLPIFGLSFIPSFTTMIINRQVITYGGTEAVAAFAVASYVLSIGQLLLQGVGEGSQPLISFYHGANDIKTVKLLRRWTYGTGIVLSIAILVGIQLLRNLIPAFFGVSKQTAAVLQIALPICAASLPLYGFSRITTEYFNAIKKSRDASIMVYGEAFLLLPVCAILLPIFYGLNGVWSAIVLVQFLLLLVGIGLRMKDRRFAAAQPS